MIEASSPTDPKILALIIKGAWIDGRGVIPGEQVPVSGDDARGLMRHGIAAPIRLADNL